MSRTKIVAGVIAVAVAAGVGVAALWDELPWAGDDQTCASPSATVRTEVTEPEGTDYLYPMLSPDGRHLLFPASEPALIDTASGKIVRAYPGSFVQVASFRADGSSFVTVQEFENDQGRAEGVAVWDVLRECYREGSLDSDIQIESESHNDFATFFRRHPQIGSVFFNGQKSESLFRRHVLPTIADLDRKFRYVRLPSTSPAHAGRSFEEKLAAWRAVVEEGKL